METICTIIGYTIGLALIGVPLALPLFVDYMENPNDYRRIIARSYESLTRLCNRARQFWQRESRSGFQARLDRPTQLHNPRMIRAWLGNQLAQPSFKSSHPRARAFTPYMRVNRRVGDRIGRVTYRAHAQAY